MKIYLASLLILNVCFLNAQPVLTRANYFDIGDSALIFTKYDSALASFNVGPSGANVTWDYSMMDFNHPSVYVDTIIYLDPTMTPHYPTHMSADYSQSNLCALLKTNSFSPMNYDYNYFFSDNDSLCFIGHWASAYGNEIWEDHCDDFIKQLSFPFAYGTSYVDSFQRFFYDMSGSDAHYINGNITVTADGYGSLVTPDGNTLQNIIRIHTVEATRDSNLFFGITNSSRHNYWWYSSDAKGFILHFEMYTSDSTSIGSAYYQKQSNVINGVGEGSKESLALITNENGIFQLNVPAVLADAPIMVSNAMGQVVFQNRLMAGLNEMNLSHQSPGVYFITVGITKRQSFRVIVH